MVFNNCFTSTLSGFVTGVKFDCFTNKGKKCWTIRCKYISTRNYGTEYNRVECYNADTVYIMQISGKEYDDYCSQEYPRER